MSRSGMGRAMAKLHIMAFFCLLLLTFHTCGAVPLDSIDHNSSLIRRQDGDGSGSGSPPSRPSSYTSDIREPGWKSEPRIRGTFRVVLSSLITYLLCVWTTIHVNVEPPPDATRLHEKILPVAKDSFLDKLLRKRIMRKLGWGFVSLLAPEVTMWIAYFELQVARKLCKELTDIHKGVSGKRKENMNEAEVVHLPTVRSLSNEKGSMDIETIPKVSREKSRKEEFAEFHYDPSHLKLGFYGVMGGFVLDQKVVERLIQRRLMEAEDKHRATLTPQCIIACAKMGILPKISVAEIDDKSNADALAKFLICIQVGWMMIQVVGRAATNLPITLLELHIVLQCACAVTMYALWWHKPLDIHLPTTVFMTQEQEVKFIEKFEKSVAENGRQVMKIDKTNITIDGPTEYKLLTSSRGLGKALYEQIFQASENDTGFWDTIHVDFVGIHKRLFAALRCSGKVAAILCILNIVWGALHLVAWNSDFPTVAERMVWRIASVVTTSVLVMELIYIPCGQFIKNDKSLLGKLYWNTGWFLWIVGFVPIIVLRAALALQGFLSMRDLPIGSYSTVVWAEMLPHY